MSQVPNLPKEHPINTLMAEHTEILKFLDELKVLSDQFSAGDREKLQSIAHHLEAAEKHHQREEDVLFPEMEERGMSGPPQAMRVEHTQLRAKKKELNDLAQTEIADLAKFQKSLKEIADFLVPNLREHIFKEDNMLYPMALQAITDAETWTKIKEKCDKIGYCCFTPDYVKKG